MRQVWITRAGGPEVREVRETREPTPVALEVLIKVHAAGINFADLMARMGLYPDAPKLPGVVGDQVAGEVTSVGPGVEHVAVGDRVMALTRFGGYSEVVCVPASQVAPIADAEALLDHAAHQHNCLANDEEYLEKIIDGTGYLYELRWEPGEDEEPAGSATLFIEGKGVLHRYWGVDDMRLRFNGEPPVWLDAQVARFLARAPASREPEAGQVATEDLLDERQLSLPFGWEWVERLGEEDGLPF